MQRGEKLLYVSYGLTGGHVHEKKKAKPRRLAVPPASTRHTLYLDLNPVLSSRLLVARFNCRLRDSRCNALGYNVLCSLLDCAVLD
jgi:hypothetical protein